ncbi:MAG TPA: hypothetical protein VMV95_02730 [Bacillota bacterium]|nr:hypothetical protein [Bacillota bacterium]
MKKQQIKSKGIFDFVKEKIFKDFLLKQYKGANLILNLNAANRTGGMRITTPNAGALEIKLAESKISTGKQTLNYEIKEITYDFKINKGTGFNLKYKK